MGAVETILVTEDFEKYVAHYTCSNGHEKTVIEDEAEIEDSVECGECGEEMELEDMSDIIEVFGEKAGEMGSELEIISTGHEEGERLQNLGGIAAILRYRIR